MLFDSHAHLNDARFNIDRRYVLNALEKNGVGAVICAGYDIESSEFALKIANENKNVYAVCGLHPDAADDFCEADIDKIRLMLNDKKCVGLGEIGLDYYYETPSREKQLILFEKQLQLAKDTNSKIVFHHRDAGGAGAAASGAVRRGDGRGDAGGGREGDRGAGQAGFGAQDRAAEARSRCGIDRYHRLRRRRGGGLHSQEGSGRDGGEVSMYHDMEYRVPYADTDQMGVVYYANYLKYFEMFRSEMLIDAGLSYLQMEKKGIAMPVLEAVCRYKRSAHFEDRLSITGRVAEAKGARVKIECEVRCGDRILADGYPIHASMDMKAGRPPRDPAA